MSSYKNVRVAGSFLIITIRADFRVRAESGVLVLQIIAGTMHKRGRLEVLIDENTSPSFVTSKARSHRNTWDQVGELVVRELDFSQITLRMNENESSEKPDISAELRVQTKSLIQSAWVSVRGDAHTTMKCLICETESRVRPCHTA
jgi:Ca2+-dependent lipid-binding protein